MTQRFQILQSYLLDARRLLERVRAAQGACRMGYKDAVRMLQEELHTWKGTSGMLEEAVPVFHALHAAETEIERELPLISPATHVFLERTWAWAEGYLNLQEEKALLTQKLGFAGANDLGILAEMAGGTGTVWIPVMSVVGLWSAGEAVPSEWSAYGGAGMTNTTDKVGLRLASGQTIIAVRAIVGLVAANEAKTRGADCAFVANLEQAIAHRRAA